VPSAMAEGRPSQAEPSAGAELARYYDLDVAGEQADLDLYLALAMSADGPLLELAAGSGRLAVPLALAGHQVTAVDIDSDMLARARRAWDAHPPSERGGGALETVETDITDLQLGRSFALVILALNSLLLMPGRDAQLACLRSVARHLAPTGRAVVDVWLPSPEDLALYDGRLNVEWTRAGQVPGEVVAKLVSARFDPGLARALVTTFFDAWPEAGGDLRRLSREDELSFVSGPELLGLAQSAGLSPVVIGQDYELTPFGTGSERMVLVCGLL